MNNETDQIFLLNPPANQITSVYEKLPEVPATHLVNLEDVENFTNVCRMCAAITEFIIPIFEGEGLQSNLADMINKHLPIQVSQSDLLPLGVCSECARALQAWHARAAAALRADAALRARLARGGRRQEQQQSAKNIESQRIEDKHKPEFKEIHEFVIPSGEPPQYVPPEVTSLSQTTLKCHYCGVEQPKNTMKEHLVSDHTDRLFHCDECDTYVDRKDFILHMSLHAVQYVTSQEVHKEDDKAPKPAQRTEDANIGAQINVQNVKVQDAQVDVQVELVQEINNKTPIIQVTSKIENRQVNEFSDHSDNEFDFGPLPESVFEAIEDSQDSQPADSNDRQENVSSSIDSNNPNPDEKIKKSRTCPICGKVYYASSSYFYHIKYFHKGTKEHDCEVCGRKFATKSSLSEHSTIHTGECRLECKECGKKFRSKASLYIHEQTHNGVKSYSCTLCKMSFRWRTHLVRHMKRHSAEKPHHCTVCGRGFSVRCDLLRHARTHTAEEHACEKCGVKFAQLRYLKVHMDKKHSANIVANRKVETERLENVPPAS